MIDEIGKNAGMVWKYLDQHGESSVAAVVKGTRLSQKTAERAIGWLAREGKIKLRKDQRAELLSLAE